MADGDMALLGIGVGLTVVAASQVALMSGLRRISELAWLNVGGAALACAIGIGVLIELGGRGVVLFVVATPLSGALLGSIFVMRARRGQTRVAAAPMFAMVRGMAGAGIAFMLSSVALLASQIFIRGIVQADLGARALGYFQAAWAVSMTYIGFVLAAMSTDYFPRLTRSINDVDATIATVNEQAEFSLLVAAPIVLVMIGTAPYLMRILYSAAFVQAAGIFQWQVLGDVLKIASWPVGYVLLAAGRGRSFLLSETTAMFVLCGFTWIAMPYIGLEAAGISFVVMYAAYLPLVLWLARRHIPIKLTRAIWVNGAILFVAVGLLMIISRNSPLFGAILSVIASLAAGAIAVQRIGVAASWRPSLARFAARIGRIADRSREGDNNAG
ncbi:MAG: oligosaccharide flippase family protein [Sphingomonadaceae bacterium]|nr:oligosaccharide flippase family protein [Sphingomonadaceae bacterium]